MSFNGEICKALMLRRRNGGHTYKMGEIEDGKTLHWRGFRVN